MALGIAFLLGCFPSGVEAKMVGSLDTGGQPLSPRQAKEAQAQRLLGEAKVAQALASAGLNTEEIRTRLGKLTDQQLEQLTESLETVKAGKGTIYVLIAVAVLLLAALMYMQIEEA